MSERFTHDLIVIGAGPAGMAAAAGFGCTAAVWTKKDLEAAIPALYATAGPVFVDIKVTTDPVPMVLPRM